MTESIDITDKIGPLYLTLEDDKPEWPMYSYDSPSYIFWNGVANGLKEAGFTDEQIQFWLQSKMARWTMDGMGHEIENLGKKIGKEQSIDEIKEWMESA